MCPDKPRRDPCAACAGTGFFDQHAERPTTCPVCNGSGRVERIPDLPKKIEIQHAPR